MDENAIGGEWREVGIGVTLFLKISATKNQFSVSGVIPILW
jgi:hypothetical protein